jgi:hypothetical protein
MMEGGANDQVSDDDVKLDEKGNRKQNTVSIMKFFKTLKGKNICMLIVAFIASFMAGLLLPSIAVVFGKVTSSFDP